MNNMKKDFWKYSSLGILGMIGSAGTILADAFFVSDRLGAEGLAAMNMAICVFGLINGTGLLFGIGGATRYTIFKAKGEKHAADAVFTSSFFIALVAGIVYAIVGILFSRPLSYLLGADAGTFAMCSTYLKTIFCFSPSFVLNHLLMSFVRNDGAPGLSMRAMMIGSLTNIVLDYIFMYPFDMGISGAAIATGIAALISISVSSLRFINEKNGLHFVRVNIRLKEIIQIVSPGMASFITEFSSGIVLVVFNLRILSVAGNIGVAAYGIVANLALMVFAVMGGISHGIQPLISTMYGKSDNKAAKKIYQKGIILTLAVGSIVFGAAAAFAPDIVRCFNGEGNQSLQVLAEGGIRLYFIGFIFAGYNHLTTAHLGAVEKPVQAFLIALFRGFIGIIVAVCLLSAFFGAAGIWLAFPAVEAVTALLCLFFGEALTIRFYRTQMQTF